MGCAALIISIIAVVVAIMIPTFFLYWEKPKLNISFEKRLGYKLMCWIKHVPPSKFQLRIGIDRRIIDIDYETTIYDMKGNIVEDTWYPTASSKNLVIPIVEIKDKDRQPFQVFLKDQADRLGKMLEPGSYMFELVIWDAKDKIQKYKRQKHFRVNSTKPFVEWIDKGQKCQNENQSNAK